MKKFLSLLGVCTSLTLGAYAANGDTTVVTAFPTTSILQYGNYDTAVAFPDGTKSYRKINMIFTLGKETCAPGSQYCAQWDYTVRLTVMTATDTFELGRFITPYAHSSYPNMPLNWKHDYVFDVTDFYSILKDTATVRFKYEGYSWGFTGAIKFEFVEGTPPRDVLAVKKMWNGSFKYGKTADPIDDHTAAQTFTPPTGTVYAEAMHIISGHGSDDQTNNCAEFCKKWYRWNVNGSSQGLTNIWRDDCGVNWVYPQSGTWVYDRANWCPGDIVFPKTLKIPAAALTDSFNASMEFQPYTSSNQNDPPSYTTSNTLFFYSEFNNNVDLGIEDIIAPSKKDLYFRMNPICGDVKVKVKNYGKNTITQAVFNYGIVGETASTYNWTGSLAPMETAIISLPSLPGIASVTGTKEFKVSLGDVNGTTDEEVENNEATSSFVAPPTWDKGNYIISMKSSGITQSGNASQWIIRDQAGNVIKQRVSTTANATNNDTVHLENGCYSLEVVAEAGYGFNFFGQFNAGTIAVKRASDNFNFRLPKNDPGNGTSLAGNFGSGFIQEFVVTNSEPPVSVKNINNNILMSLSPNPASQTVTVAVEGVSDANAMVRINNILGQTVLTVATPNQQNTIDLTSLPAGIYTLTYECNQGAKVEKLVINK